MLKKILLASSALTLALSLLSANAAESMLPVKQVKKHHHHKKTTKHHAAKATGSPK